MPLKLKVHVLSLITIENGSDTSEAEEMAEDEDEYVDTFYISAVAHWDNIKGLSTDINVELNSLKWTQRGGLSELDLLRWIHRIGLTESGSLS